MVCIKLVGIDLAWKIDKHPTGLAFGSLSGNTLTLDKIDHKVFPTVKDLVNDILDYAPRGISIDAPLIVKNKTGQRPCETLIGQAYGARHASCHTTNLSKYPSLQSVSFSELLQKKGYQHLFPNGKWQIECYPHPALIEIFKLTERLKYKKGTDQARKEGQANLGKRLLQLQASKVLSLVIPDNFKYICEKTYIDNLVRGYLKANEDIMDAIICLYIAGLYSLFPSNKVFGNTIDGYIYVPVP